MCRVLGNGAGAAAVALGASRTLGTLYTEDTQGWDS